MTGNEVREKFLEYFAKHRHQIVRSSSLVPLDDPSLLFINAGMVQFKRTFLGEEKRSYVRATTSQKCVRAGGKHNDLENVGYTARHHTFFEMLGNFSFGDYFKEKAIEFAWDLLTNGYGLPADDLWISIYLDDDEAHELWHRNIGIPVDRIVRFGEEDNFWAMGDTGPCGPCSEIHLDRGETHGCGKPDCKIGCDCDRFLEIWNLVFMQFDRDNTGKLTPLPKPSIDTGLGLERMVSIMQNVPTNFETDLLFPIILEAERLSELRFGESSDADVAMKVIADHSRAAAFLINDGVLPSNEGRGYVLRRIMRRAIRYGRNIGLTKPFLHKTAGTVFDVMKPSYPELTASAPFIKKVIENEEARFSETLGHGLKLLNEALADLREKKQTRVPGALIFKLYDTYGFPIDIIRDIVRDEGLILDIDGFDAAMLVQRTKSRSVVAFTTAGEAYKKLSSQGIRPDFLGYQTTSSQGKVLAIVSDGNELNEAHPDLPIEIITNQTPFYGEAGGQMGDAGWITGDKLMITVFETIKDPTGLIIHRSKIDSGTLRKGQFVNLTVDREKRAATACNHTATHILHAILRKILGDHVKQAGSHVCPDRLRFDFTHFTQVNETTLEEIETLVNHRIRENIVVNTDQMDAESAFKSGATALFEEKYGDTVRVVSLGDFSKELCGGTHTDRTGNIGLFKITGESSVASGVRRIEALTGVPAIQHSQKALKTLQSISRLVMATPEETHARIQKIIADNKILEKQLTQLKAKYASTEMENIHKETQSINGVTVLAKRVVMDTSAGIRDLADRFAEKIKSGIVVLGSTANDKVLLIARVTKDLTDTYHAGTIIKAVAAVAGGGGGGRPDMAQAGGNDPKKLDPALEKTFEIISKIN